jgi:anti-sigma regulatory factor (Ser/Thr protein kinase)
MLTELSLSLSPAASASSAARAAVRERFTGVLSRAAISDLELVISELVTNGVEHGRGSVRVDVDVAHSGHEISGSVSDDGTGFDYELRAFPGHGSRGRGLAIVNALVTRWGIRRGSTQVWFVTTLGES